MDNFFGIKQLAIFQRAFEFNKLSITSLSIIH